MKSDAEALAHTDLCSRTPPAFYTFGEEDWAGQTLALRDRLFCFAAIWSWLQESRAHRSCGLYLMKTPAVDLLVQAERHTHI